MDESSEARIGEAVAALRGRLSGAGCPEPDALAVELLGVMQRLGWRPTLPAQFVARVVPERERVTGKQARAYADAARAAMRRALQEPQEGA